MLKYIIKHCLFGLTIVILLCIVVVNVDNFFRLNFLQRKMTETIQSIKQNKQWSNFNDESYAKQNGLIVDQLKQDIQDEVATRVLHNWELQKQINQLKIIESKPKAHNLVDSIKNTIGFVVHIANLSRGWQGSGVAWSEDIIVTARHVVKDGTDFEITLNDGTKVRATEAISSEKYDIGFIKLDKKILKPAEFGSVKETVLGQQVYVIGSPYGKINFNFVSLGIVSGLNRNMDSIDPYSGRDYGWSIAFTSDSAGHPGNSGCPVFTLDRKVRGILVGGYSPVLNICMPSDLFIDKLAVIEMMFEQRKFYSEEIKDDYNRNYYRQWDLE